MNGVMRCAGDMAGVAKGIARLGALFYVAYRVWQSLARAEPMNVFPMPVLFAIGLCIMFFPTVVLGTIKQHPHRRTGHGQRCWRRKRWT